MSKELLDDICICEEKQNATYDIIRSNIIRARFTDIYFLIIIF